MKLTKSENFIEEYSCSVVRIGDVIPVPNSDFLGQTFVNSTSLVVRKDKVQKGDIMFYASNETQLYDKFLGANNLFEIGEYTRNANVSEVEKVILQINRLKEDIKKYKNDIKVKEKLKKKADEEKLASLQSDIDSIKLNIDNTTAKVDELKASIKSKAGFFNKYGRVKMLRLKGVPSMGYLFTLDELKAAFPSIKNEEIGEDLIGTYFDTVEDTLFVKVYVPPIKEEHHTGNGTSQNEDNSNKIDRLIPGEFAFHYNTNRLNDNVFKIHPNDTINISVKLHGTSFIAGNIKCNIPIKLPWYKKVANKIIKRNSVFKFLRFKETYVGYDNVYSSRTVIRNRYSTSMNNISTDVYGFFNEILSPYIPEGYTIYGEIVGYKPNSTTFIQKNYDYGLEPCHAKLMIYRINREVDGKHYELNVQDVYNWTVNRLISQDEDLKDLIRPIDILYHGKVSELYPDIEINDDFGKNFVQRLANDSERFGMEQLEPFCKNEVPREGLVIRIDDDDVNEAFKLKCYAFLEMEGKAIDSGNVDMEMSENNNY
jgi:hypothetical protein